MIDKHGKKNPGKIKIYWENIPEELKKQKSFCCWVWKKVGKKWTKPPCDINGNIGNHQKINHTYEEVKNAYEDNKHIAGIGVSLRDNDSFCGIDIDDCLDSNSELVGQTETIVKKFDSYTEISPSGAGLRVFGTGTPKTLGASKNRNIEIYNSGRYLTITGNVINGTSVLKNIEKPANKLAKKFKKFRKKQQGKLVSSDTPIKISHLISKLTYIDPDLHRDDWINICLAIHDDFVGTDTGFDLFVRWSRGDFWRNGKSKKFEEESCFESWKSIKGNTDKKRTIRTIDYYYKQHRPGIIEIKEPKVKEIKNLLKFPENPYKGVNDFAFQMFETFQGISAQPIKQFLYMAVEATLQYFAADYILTPLKRRTCSTPMIGAGLSTTGKDLNTSVILSQYRRELMDYAGEKALGGILDTVEYLGEKSGSHTSSASLLAKFANGSLRFWLDTEASGIIRVLADIENPHGGGSLTICLNELYDGHSIAGKNFSQTKKNIENIPNPHLPIIWLTQIDTFASLLTPELLDVGFLGRIDYFFDLEKRKEISSFSKSFKERRIDLKLMEETIKFLVWRNDQKKKPAKITDEALLVMQEWEEDNLLNQSRHPNYTKFLRRIVMSAEKRLSVYSLFNKDKKITKDLVLNHIPMLDYQLNTRCHVYENEISGNDLYMDVKETIQMLIPQMPKELKKKGWVKWVSFQQAFRNKYRNKYKEANDAIKMRNQLQSLQFQGLIMFEELRGHNGKFIKLVV